MNDMNFQEFKDYVAEHIKELLPEKYEESKVAIQEVVKNNATLSAITIQSPDSNVSPTIYLDNYFAQYQDGKDMGLIMTDIARLRMEYELDQSFDVNSITDFDQVKDKIAARLVGAEGNEKLLENRPYTMVDDLAVTYCVMLGDSPDGSMSVPITNALMENYGINVEQLHALAMTNMDQLSPAIFKSMNEVMKEMMMPQMLEQCGGDEVLTDQMMSAMCPPDVGNMYVLSNEQKLNGAAVLLNESVMEQVAEKVGGEFYILPSSIHETLIIPKSAGMERAELENMVQEVNATQVAPQDRLSDHVYTYDNETHEIYRADKEEEHAASKEADKSIDASKEARNAETVEVSIDDKAPVKQGKTSVKKSRTSEQSLEKSAEKKSGRKRTSVKAKLAEKQKEVAATKNEVPARDFSKKKEASL